KVSCLFGENLLRGNSKPVALVEAPKTALYCWLYFKDFEPLKDIIWLAVYNKSSFSFDKLKVLKGRFVFVFPDLSEDGGTFNEWKDKAKDFEKRLSGTRFIFSDLLESFADKEDKEQGNDIADIIIKQDWRKFRAIEKNKCFLEANYSNSSNSLRNTPKWLVDAKGILQRYEQKEIDGNTYRDLLQKNADNSGISMDDYIRETNGGLS